MVKPLRSVPCGMAGDLPIGFQILGKMFDEESILRVADVYERATAWHRESPALTN